MTQCRTGEGPLGDGTDVDLAAEDCERLARVDALLRVIAADDLAGTRDSSRPAGSEERE